MCAVWGIHAHLLLEPPDFPGGASEPQQAFHHLPGAAGGQRCVDLFDRELVRDELGRRKSALADPLGERPLGLPFTMRVVLVSLLHTPLPFLTLREIVWVPLERPA